MQFTGTDLFLVVGGLFLLWFNITGVLRNAYQLVGTLLVPILGVATGIMLLVNAIASYLGLITTGMQKTAAIVISSILAFGLVFLVRQIASSHYYKRWS
jgi:hypothetical protein